MEIGMLLIIIMKTIDLSKYGIVGANEIVYNPCLDEFSTNLLTGQNPSEVFWR